MPFVLSTVAFYAFDPFKIIHNHNDSYFVEDGTIDGFTLNRDIVATEMFIQKKDSLYYDSFIFGSSRASGFLSDDWATYINNDAPPFHFIGSGESLFGIWSKLKYLEKIDHKIDYALFSIDHDLLSKDSNGKGIIAIRDHRTAGQTFNFFLTHFKEYISSDFFIQYLDYKFFKTRRAYMDKLFDNMDRGLRFDNDKNDWIHHKKNEHIKSDSLGYYDKMTNIFYSRSHEALYSESVIGNTQKKYLSEIKQILENNKTEYKLIINPLYDQKSISKADLNYLEIAFGHENVNDYSGINDMTESKGNYYETSHFKPFIGKRIIEEMYE